MALTSELIKLKLGNRAYYLSENTFNGALLVHIRKHYESKEINQENEGKLFPSKFGATLNVNEWMELAES